MADSLGFAVKITGDASNLEKSINDATITIENQSKKAVKALKDQRDAYGVLRDEQGRIVDGLSKWQRALGYYVDELGTVRTANDRFVDGLTTIQKKIGMEVDELGNIYNKTGQIVGTTSKAVKDFGDAEKQATLSANDLQSALENALNKTIGDNIEKMQRDLLGISGAFQKVKGGFDALLGSNNGISKAVDNIGKLSQAIVGFKQAGETIAQATATLKSFAATLTQAGAAGKGATATTAAGFGNVSKAATGAGAAIAAAGASISSLATGIGVAIVAATALDKLMKSIYGEAVVDPEHQRALDNYAEQFKKIESRARAAGIEIKSLSDALAFGALDTGGHGTELDQILGDWKKTLQTGISTSSRREIEQETQILGDTLTEASIRLFGTEKDDIARERAAVFGAINARVKEVTEKQKTESEKLLEQIHDLDHAVNMVDDAEQAAQLKAAISKLVDEYNRVKEQEAKEAKLATIRAAGLDRYIKEQNDAEITLDNARAKFAEWYQLAQNGSIEWREYYQATAAASEEMRQAVASKTGATFATASKKAAETFEELRKACAAGIISAQEANDAWRDFQKNAAASIASSFNLDLDSEETKKTLDDLNAEIQKQLQAGAINQEQADKLVDAWKKKAAQELEATANEAKKRREALAKETGVKIDGIEGGTPAGASSIANSLRENQKKWADALAAGDVTQEQYNAALKALADNARKAYDEQSMQMDAQAKAQAEYNKRIAELADLAKEGVISAQERQDEERKAREKMRDAQRQADPQAMAALNSLRAQANQEQEQRTWQEELKAQLDAVKAARKKGLITQAEMHEAEAAYTKIKKQRTKQEQAEMQRAARDAARSDLGVDSIMESLKTPLQKFNETIAKLNDAAGYLTMDEYAAVYQNAIKEFQEANQTLIGDAGGATSKSEKATAGGSITAGSDTFYKTLVASLAPGNYETTMKDTTKQIADTTVQGNALAQEGNALLLQIAQNMQGIGGGEFAVFGG